MTYSKNFVIAFGFVVVLAVGCGAKTETGLCSLKCGNSIIGDDTHHRITAVSNDTNIICSQLGPVNSPLTGIFRVDDTDVVDSVFGGAATTRLVPGIFVRPHVDGNLDPCSTHPSNGTVEDLGNGNCSVDPFDVHGIATPKSDWCTDTCGIATFQFVPFCTGNDTSTVITARSGALSSTSSTGQQAISITYTQPEE